MPKNNIAITYSLFTEESIEAGDAEEHGFEVEYEDNWTLREAIEFMYEKSYGMVHASCYPMCTTPNGHKCWFSIYTEIENDEHFEYSLHIKDITPSTRLRIGKLLGAC